MSSTWAPHNVIATYLDGGQAKQALNALKNQHYSEMSFLSRSDEELASQNVLKDEAEEVPAEVASRSAKGAAAGGAAGGLVGLVAGGVAFAIPGVGPAVGAGIWAATAGGVAAGATAGGVAGGITMMWEERYEDAVREGSILVGVHSADAGRVQLAAGLLKRQGPDRLDVFDAEGKPIE